MSSVGCFGWLLWFCRRGGVGVLCAGWLEPFLLSWSSINKTVQNGYFGFLLQYSTRVERGCY